MNTVFTSFNNKVALVTGGCSGIGRATVLRFSSEGAAVVIADVNEAAGISLSEEISQSGGKSLFLRCDVTDEADLKSLIKKIDGQFGQLDYSFNNAGIGGEFAKLEDYSVEDWHKVLSVNLTSVFLCMKYQIPLMLKSSEPAIVNCASVLSNVAYENDSAYVASKFGVLGLTKNAALEYAKSGLRINAVSPGFTKTPMVDTGDEEKIRRISALHPIGRLASPEEIANGVLWLCSNQASFAIGMNLLIDGGYTLT